MALANGRPKTKKGRMAKAVEWGALYMKINADKDIQDTTRRGPSRRMFHPL